MLANRPIPYGPGIFLLLISSVLEPYVGAGAAGRKQAADILWDSFIAKLLQVEGDTASAELHAERAEKYMEILHWHANAAGRPMIRPTGRGCVASETVMEADLAEVSNVKHGHILLKSVALR